MNQAGAAGAVHTLQLAVAGALRNPAVRAAPGLSVRAPAAPVRRVSSGRVATVAEVAFPMNPVAAAAAVATTVAVAVPADVIALRAAVAPVRHQGYGGGGGGGSSYVETRATHVKNLQGSASPGNGQVIISW